MNRFSIQQCRLPSNLQYDFGRNSDVSGRLSPTISLKAHAWKKAEQMFGALQWVEHFSCRSDGCFQHGVSPHSAWFLKYGQVEMPGIKAPLCKHSQLWPIWRQVLLYLFILF